MKCLITTLKENVNDPYLRKIGELRIKAVPQSGTVVKSYQIIHLQSAIAQTISIINGDGYFTDSTLSKNNGTTYTLTPGSTKTIYVSDGTYEIVIPNKYELEVLEFNVAAAEVDSHFSIPEYENMNYMLKLKTLSIPYKAPRKLEDMSKMNSIESMILASSEITGSTESLAEHKNTLTTLSLNNVPIYGTLKDIGVLTKLESLGITGDSIIGDIGDLKTLTKLTNLSLTMNELYGSISNLKTLEKLETLLINKPSVGEITGELADLPSSVYFLSSRTRSTTFNWTKDRATTAYIIALEGVNFRNSLDAMLISQSKCTAYTLTNASQTWYKTFKVFGTRTTASDSAVATLKAKGYRIMINGTAI